MGGKLQETFDCQRRKEEERQRIERKDAEDERAGFENAQRLIIPGK